MPKVVIDNTKGLRQITGGGAALFGGVQAITATGTDGSATPILATTSLALVSSADNTYKSDLPAIADLEIGHTIVIASVGAADIIINTPGSETVNGAASVTLGEDTAIVCVKATATTWVVVKGA